MASGRQGPRGGIAVREVAVAAALGGRVEGVNPLRSFAAEPSPIAALGQWFGTERLADLSGDADALCAAIDRDIVWIDSLLNRQVDAILHHPRFQRLEASWRGVRYLVEQAHPDDGAIVRMIHCAWRELRRDLDQAAEFDQSECFKKIYESEFGHPGGSPYGVLIGDYFVSHHPVDVVTLRGVAQVAAAAFAPFIVGCTPGLFGLERFAQLGLPLDLPGQLRSPEYAQWRSFQSMPDARFVGVVLPKVLMRLPYEDDGTRDDGFAYRERVEGTDCDQYLWGCAGYSFAAVLIRTFLRSGWFADIRGVRQMPDDMPEFYNGGLVPDLHVHTFATDPEDTALKYSVEVSVSEHVQQTLSEMGFMAITDCPNTRWSAFRSAQSVHQQEQYTSEIATTNARLTSMLQYVFCVSRFSHYIKIIIRDKTGGFTTAEECESFLMSWLFQYVDTAINATRDQKSRYPLQDASVRVRPLPGHPGNYTCIVHFQPHFQPKDVVANFRLITELSPAAAA